MSYWQIKPEWEGGTAYIVGGGPSLLAVDLDALRGQRIIAINSSCFAVPFAAFCIFSDSRWWEHNRPQLLDWKGRIICCSRTVNDPRVLRVQRRNPPALDQPNDCLGVQFTTATGAIELAVRLGAQKLVLLGIDGRNADNGKSHHHKPHPWPPGVDWQNRHRNDLKKMMEPLQLRHIEVVLGTSSTYEDLWPRINLATEMRSLAA